jgi:hypothetical protein
MRSKLLGVMTGVALLASLGVANASQRAPLTDAQLDSVTAGVALAQATAAVEGGTAAVTATLTANNTSATAGSASATIQATFTPGTGIPPHVVAVQAIATAP